MGGLSLTNICQTAELEYGNSVSATERLANAIYIYEQEGTFKNDEKEQKDIVSTIKQNRQRFFETAKNELAKGLSPSVLRQLELLSEKGASSWLTSLPLQ